MVLLGNLSVSYASRFTIKSRTKSLFSIYPCYENKTKEHDENDYRALKFNGAPKNIFLAHLTYEFA